MFLNSRKSNSNWLKGGGRERGGGGRNVERGHL